MIKERKKGIPTNEHSQSQAHRAQPPTPLRKQPFHLQWLFPTVRQESTSLMVDMTELKSTETRQQLTSSPLRVNASSSRTSFSTLARDSFSSAS